MQVSEFSSGEFIHGLLISKELFINKIAAAPDRPRTCPP